MVILWNILFIRNFFSSARMFFWFSVFLWKKRKLGLHKGLKTSPSITRQCEWIQKRLNLKWVLTTVLHHSITSEFRKGWNEFSPQRPVNEFRKGWNWFRKGWNKFRKGWTWNEFSPQGPTTASFSVDSNVTDLKYRIWQWEWRQEFKEILYENAIWFYSWNIPQGIWPFRFHNILHNFIQYFAKCPTCNFG